MIQTTMAKSPVLTTISTFPTAWNCYVKRVIDEDFSKVNSGRWLNPNAVMIFSHQPEDMASVELPTSSSVRHWTKSASSPYPNRSTMRSPTRISACPSSYKSPDGGKVNTAFNWIKTGVPTISSASVQNLVGAVTAYSNFKPTDGNVQIRGSYTAPGSTKAEYVFSNEAHITLRNPLKPVVAMSYETARSCGTSRPQG